MKLMIVVTHLLGIGHLNRAAALGRAFARAGHAVVLISGGRPAPTVDMSGVTLVQLPPVHIRGTDFKTLFSESGEQADNVLFEERIKILEDNIHKFAPDAVIVELFPFGRRQLADEFGAALSVVEALGCVRPVFCSVRDVLAPPSTAKKRAGVDAWLARHFSAVLVHGDAHILPLEASWPVSAGLSRMLRYTGYVRDGVAGTVDPAGEGLGEILMSGGGSDASVPLLKAALAAARLDPQRRWRLLAGHGIAADVFANLQSSAPPNATVERVRKDFSALLARAVCSISMAGYNTMLDLAAAGVPAVIVPFDAGGEVEQTIRAEKFAEMGLVTVVPAADLSAEGLLQGVDAAMARGRQTGRLAMSGAAMAVEIVETEISAAQALDAAWQAVDAALDRAKDVGRSVSFWWRDDDAVQASPELDRMLTIAGDLSIPLALAVIPDKVKPDLAERLASEPLVSVLVHGIAHTNHAQPGQKKQELVAADDETITALTNARASLRKAFGAQALPVLVPPWNRIAHDLVAHLPDMGFVGLSTFADEAVVTGLRVVNCHVDPIDWKGGCGLSGALAHIRHTAALIDARVAARSDAPIGLLTHHLVHDAWIWRFVEQWLRRLTGHGAARFVGAGSCFGLTDGGGRAPKEQARHSGESGA